METGLALVALGGDRAVVELQGGEDKRVMPSVLELLLEKASCNPGVNPEVLQVKGIKGYWPERAFRNRTEAL